MAGTNGNAKLCGQYEQRL